MDERYRAIIIKDDRILLMKRCFKDNTFYVFPGGGIEANENPKECCEREVCEEFGITIKAKQMIYLIHQGSSKQGFFVCDWVSGDIHKTDAEEYTENNRYGSYEPLSVPLSETFKLDVMPPEVAIQLEKDLEEFGTNLNRPLIEIECSPYIRKGD